MVRLYDMFPAPAASRHQPSYGLTHHQPYAYQYYEDPGTPNSATVDSGGAAVASTTGGYQSCAWPTVYAVTTANSGRQYDEWVGASGGAQQQAFGYTAGYHPASGGATDYSIPVLHHSQHHQGAATDGGPSPDSAVAVSSDGMSGSESPGLSLGLEMGPPNLGKPQQARSPFEWMKRTSYQSQPNPGKTRTKDKYRVVYTDHQRLELEKEFHYSRYITIRRKSELAGLLGLSERQVKIWFQNRRAKERKQAKKREEILQKVKEPTIMHQNNAALAALNIFKPIVHFDNESHM